MRIRKLEIEQFGIFANHELDFSSDSLQVVYGPNEAGKSTLLQLIREVLFGFAVRNPYAFPDHTSEMAAIAMLEMANGDCIRFRRRKGRRDAVVGEYLGGTYRDGAYQDGEQAKIGQAIDEAGLNRLLGSANVDLFRNVFGFSLTELTAGQQSLEHAKLGEALYGGALGGLTGFRQVLESLEKDQESLFSPAATKKPINRLLTDLRKRSKELRNAMVRPRDYLQWERELQELQDSAEQLRQQRDELQRRQRRCEQLAQAVVLWQRRSQLTRALAGLQIPQGFPRDGEQQFEQCRALRDQITSELDSYRQELSEVSGQLENLAPQAGLLEQAGQIQRLAQQLDKIRGFRQDSVLRQQEARDSKATVLVKLQELDPSWTLEHLLQFNTSVAHSASISAMHDELNDLQQREQGLVSQRPALEADIDTMQRQLEALPDEQVALPLVELVEGANECETRREKLEQLQQQERELVAQSDGLERKLNAPFSHQLEGLCQLAVPMVATVAEYRQQLGEFNQQVERRALRVERAEADLLLRTQEFDSLRAEEQVPDRAQLDDIRAHRDLGWDLVRRKFVERESVQDEEVAEWAQRSPETLPADYAQRVSDADQVADQRQQHAETVARLDQLARDIAQAEQLLANEQVGHAASVSAKEQCLEQWRGLWEPSGIEPENPDAMLEWLKLHHELIDLVAQREAVQGHQQVQQKWLDAYTAKLDAAVADRAGTPAAQIVEARRRVQLSREAAADRKSYGAQLPRKQHQLSTLKRELAELTQQREQWDGQWRLLLEQLGFPPSWDVPTVTTVLSGLNAARAQQKLADSLDERVRDMQAGIETFETEVLALCEILAPQLKKNPAEHVVEELGQMLQQTRDDTSRQQTLEQQQAKLEQRCEAKQQQLAHEEGRLKRLLEQAELQQEEALPELARRVRRWHETREDLEAVEHQLQAIRGAEEPALFEEALEGADEAELKSQEQILMNELQQVEQQFTESLQAQGVAAKRLKELDRAGQALVLAQDIESSRSQLAEAVDQWAPLVLARAFMVHSLERFQRDHQPQLLIDVSRLMQRMTMGKYTELSHKLDEQGSLQIHQADGRIKEPHQLSTGTREQLYLAIRLAYVLHYCRDAEPLPIIMDDVLVNFDDQRAAETLDALVEVSQEVQLVLLTCHQYTLELVQSRLPKVKPIILGA